MKKGLDVSSHNGDIDWGSVINAGYGDFAIIRLGYGGDLSKQDDAKFERNVNECERLNIPYGVYIYSYSMNLADVDTEVKHTLRQLKKVGKNFKYGVWFDMEDADNYKKNRGMQIYQSNQILSDICYSFCDQIEKAGYYTGIYASLYWLNNIINDSKLDRFDKWVAQWNNSGCTYGKTYSIWQYTSDCIINGKRFDANELKRDFANSGWTPTPQPSKKSNEEIANEVIAGKWGNGNERKQRLAQAGYDYNTIQAIVNSKLGVKPSKKSNEEIANEVIAGKWGNNPDRKNKLINAGYDYKAIQAIVNKKLK